MSIQVPNEAIMITYRIPYGDTDQMKVVYYAIYLRYFEMVRNEIFRNSGLSYKELEERGLQFPVGEAHCRYLNGARYDDIIHIYGWISKIEGARVEICYKIYRESELLITGSTIHVFTNLEWRPRRVPDYFKPLLVEWEDPDQ